MRSVGTSRYNLAGPYFKENMIYHIALYFGNEKILELPNITIDIPESEKDNATDALQCEIEYNNLLLG